MHKRYSIFHAITLVWPYVRTLLYDIIRPQIQTIPSEFADIRWGDKLIEDIAKEAHTLSEEYISTDFTLEDWTFITKVFPQIFMNETIFSDKGYISEKGREAIVSKSLLAKLYSDAHDEKDLYWKEFQTWKGMPEFNIDERTEVIIGESTNI